jgi:hypothetical protein
MELTEYNNITDPPPQAEFAQRCRSFRFQLTTQIPYCYFHVVIKMQFVGQLLAHDPGEGWNFLISRRTRLVLEPCRLLFNGCWSLFYLEWSDWGVRLTTHFHLVLRLRISGAISPVFYTPSWRGQVKNYLILPYYPIPNFVEIRCRNFG